MGDRLIKEAVRQLSGFTTDQARIVPAEVVSVNQDARTCKVKTVGGAASVDIENVRLMESVDDGFLLIPAVGSTIIVAHSTYNLPFVLLFSKLDKVLLIGGECSVEISEKIKLNGDNLGGLVKIIKLTEKLNNLENKVNGIINQFNLHTHTGVTTGPGTSGTTATPITGTLTPTQQSDIENEKILHGDQ